jgi:hypothetical protein
MRDEKVAKGLQGIAKKSSWSVGGDSAAGVRIESDGLETGLVRWWGEPFVKGNPVGGKRGIILTKGAV